MANHLLVDLYNVVLRTTCPRYQSCSSVIKLINDGKISVTEAADAFVRRVFRRRMNYASIRFVIDSKPMRIAKAKDKHIIVEDGEKTIDIHFSGDGDGCIIFMFSRENNERPYAKGDVVHIVTEDGTLRRKIQVAKNHMKTHQRPRIYFADVPSRYTVKGIVPMVIDVAHVVHNGMTYLKPFSSQEY